jgi:hypothetical protein
VLSRPYWKLYQQTKTPTPPKEHVPWGAQQILTCNVGGIWRWASKLLGHTSKFVATLMTDRSPGRGSLLGEVEIPSHLGSISSVPSFGGTIDTRTTARLWGKLDQLQLACSNSLTKMGDLWVLGWSSTLYWYDSKGSSSGSLNGAFPLSLAATSCITFENRHRYPVQPLPSLKYSGHCLVIKV